MRAQTSSSSAESRLEDEEESSVESCVLAWEMHLETGLFAGIAVIWSLLTPLFELWLSGGDVRPHITETGLKSAGIMDENITHPRITSCEISLALSLRKKRLDKNYPWLRRSQTKFCMTASLCIPTTSQASVIGLRMDIFLRTSYDYSLGIRSGFQTYYRSINRDNIWNDPYHGSMRTWFSFFSHMPHAESRSASLDAVFQFEAQEATRKAFIHRSRSGTRRRLLARREYNRRRAGSASMIPFGPDRHSRQDVCSGLTSVIGGDIRNLPHKALRNIITPSIEEMDADATRRLEARLKLEREQNREKADEAVLRRKEILDFGKKRQEYFDALDRLSGTYRPKTAVTQLNRAAGQPSRVEQLSRPKVSKPLRIADCLDGLELTHVHNREVIEALHRKPCD